MQWSMYMLKKYYTVSAFIRQVNIVAEHDLKLCLDLTVFHVFWGMNSSLANLKNFFPYYTQCDV